MKKLLCIAVLVAFAGAAYASNDVATPGTPGQGTRQITQVGYFPINENNYAVGTGFDGQYVWVAAGDQATGTCMFYLYDEMGNLVDQGAQGAGATSWGHRDLAWAYNYMWGSYSNLVDAFTYAGAGVFIFEGYFVGAPINPNRALAFDGTYFYSGGFSVNLYKMLWNGTFGTSATYENLGGPYAGTYGLAYDCGLDCLWMTTAASTGEIYQFDTTGFPLNIYTDPAHLTFGGCEMVDHSIYGYVLGALVQETPDGIVYYDVGSTGPSATEPASWGSIKNLFQ